MKILGIDPGSRKAGFAVIESNGRKIDYLDSGLCSFEHISDFIKRPGQIYRTYLELLLVHKPDVAAIESLIFVKNPTSLMKLAQARGAIIAAINNQNIPLVEYSPNLIKSSVAGFGHSSKEGIKKSLELIFGKRDFKSSDESDALAIAVCHAVNGNRPAQVKDRKSNRTLRETFAKYEV